MSELRVLVLEDDPLTASAYEEYLRRLSGVRLVRVLSGAREARGFIAARLHAQGDPAAVAPGRPGSAGGSGAAGGSGTAGAAGTPALPGEWLGADLVLVDMNLADGHGLEVLRRLRAGGWRGGAIALTAAAEREVVRGSVALGISRYLLKPFTFEEFAAAIGEYRDLNARLGSAGTVDGQEDLDAIFGVAPGGPIALPKGLTLDTLGLLRSALAEHAGPASASELGAVVGLSRVTARRYLEHLVATGQATRGTRHGTPGRPEVEYSPA